MNRAGVSFLLSVALHAASLFACSMLASGYNRDYVPVMRVTLSDGGGQAGTPDGIPGIAGGNGLDLTETRGSAGEAPGEPGAPALEAADVAEAEIAADAPPEPEAVELSRPVTTLDAPEAEIDVAGPPPEPIPIVPESKILETERVRPVTPAIEPEIHRAEPPKPPEKPAEVKPEPLEKTPLPVPAPKPTPNPPKPAPKSPEPVPARTRPPEKKPAALNKPPAGNTSDMGSSQGDSSNPAAPGDPGETGPGAGTGIGSGAAAGIGTGTDGGIDSAPVTVVDASSLVVIKKVHQEYPAISRKRREQGTVVLLIGIASGRVTSVKIEHSSGYAPLDESAVRAVRGWVFDTTGMGELVTARIPFRFALK